MSLRWILVGLAMLLAPAAWAQDAYPSRPVRIIVGYAPGGSVDIVARLMAGELQRRLGQPFVVENRSGAAGNVGTDFVAKSAPDGYTLLMAGAAPIVTSPFLFRDLPYNPQRDFAPITLIALQGNMLVVNPALPVRSVQEFIAYARANPGRVNYGSAGIGASQHLAAEAFAARAGVSMTHVPYRGGAPAMADVISGQLQAMFETIPGAIGAVRGNQVRALGVTTARRSAAIPDLPTIAESGVPGYEARVWLGLLGPAGIPATVIGTIDRNVREILTQPDIVARFVDLGLDITESTPASFRAFLQSELDSNKAIVEAARITPD